MVKVLRIKNMDYKNSDGSWKWDAFEQAKKRGCFDDVKYLHENGCPWTKRTSTKAVKYGQLNILKYVHEKGCPWNEYACRHYAVKYGHLKCLKYLLDYDCPIDVETYNNCAIRYKTETWFQVYMYVKKGIINKYTLHIHHKVFRIQRAWHRYAYNPSSKIGHERMLKSLNENKDELENM